MSLSSANVSVVCDAGECTDPSVRAPGEEVGGRRPGQALLRGGGRPRRGVRVVGGGSGLARPDAAWRRWWRCRTGGPRRSRRRAAAGAARRPSAAAPRGTAGRGVGGEPVVDALLDERASAVLPSVRIDAMRSRSSLRTALRRSAHRRGGRWRRGRGLAGGRRRWSRRRRGRGGVVLVGVGHRVSHWWKGASGCRIGICARAAGSGGEPTSANRATRRRPPRRDL
jgi:hypothetical protein